MAYTGNGSLATLLFLFMIPAALHKGRITPLKLKGFTIFLEFFLRQGEAEHSLNSGHAFFE